MSELCQETAELAVLDDLDERKISKLRGFNAGSKTDPVSGHHIFSRKKMFRTIAVLLVITLFANGNLSAEVPVADQVARLKPGRKIRVSLKSGETLKGKMGSTASDEFTLEPGNKSHGTARVVRFSETQSVKPDGLTAGQKWAIFGAVWLTLGLLGRLV